MTGETLIRLDLVNKIIEETNLQRPLATSLLESVLKEISEALQQGETVKLSSFGTFSVRQKKERTGRNPRTGEEAKITPRQVISFKASPIVKKMISS